MESGPSEAPPLCPACGAPGGVKAVFCATCGSRVAPHGAPVVAIPAERARQAWGRVRSACFFYLSILAVVVVFAVSDTEQWLVGSYVAVDAVTAVLVLGFAWPIRREIVPLFRLPRVDAISWALFLLGPCALWLVNEGLLYAIRDLPETFVADPALDLREAGASTGVVVLLLCVTTPLLEEVAFRGILLEAIRESFGTVPAAIVVSVLFSILHLAILSFVPFAALALVFAALRFRTGSLWPSIAGHALYNLAGVLLPG